VPLLVPFDARLVSARSLTPTVRELTFERVDGQALEFQPGQWVSAFLPVPAEPMAPTPEGTGHPETIKRSYSIASAPAGTPRFDIAVTRVQNGPGSTWLHALEPGTALSFLGPQGFFTRRPLEASPSLMIATGTGLTPMRSMVQAAVSAGSEAPIWILLGVRHEEDVLYADEIASIVRAHPYIRFDVTLSQPKGAWAGRRGYVQTHVRELWDAMTALGRGTPHAYVCGLERMVGSVRALLRKEMGLPREVVHTERYD
jgi:ferredoxin-NADP reductase